MPARIALYGAGRHTDWVAYLTGGIKPCPRVVAVLDDGQPGPYSHFNVAQITRPESHAANPQFDAVVISTDVEPNALKMMQKARQLYGNRVKILNLYENCPEGLCA